MDVSYKVFKVDQIFNWFEKNSEIIVVLETGGPKEVISDLFIQRTTQDSVLNVVGLTAVKTFIVQSECESEQVGHKVSVSG